MNQRLVQEHRRVVEEKLRLERVGAVDDQVVLRQQAGDVRRSNILRQLVETNRRVEQADAAGSRFDFRPADVAFFEDDLAVQVREFHRLVVDESETAHTGRRQVQRHR